MRRILFSKLVLSSVSVCILGVCTAMAQAPGGAGQSPSTPQSSPSSRPTSPDMNGPAGSNPGNTPDTTTRKIDDKKFLKDAAIGGMTEVELGKLAQQKASSDAVKQFGQKMVDDHTKANDQLKEVASKENVAIPDALDSKHESRINKLAKLSGPDFDKAYIKDQVKDHQQDVSEFKTEADNGSDPSIKQFASNTLPTLEQHLNMAKELNKSERKSSTK